MGDRQKILHQEQQIIDGNVIRSYMSPDKMKLDEPDYIVVALLAFSKEITQTLIDYGVDINKIVTANKSNMLPLSLFNISKTPASVDWKSYYIDAGKGAGMQFDEIVKPIILNYKEKINYSMVIDFACGEGRTAQFLGPISSKLYIVDSSHSAIEVCKEKFATHPHVTPLCNASGCIPVEAYKFSFIYTWDAIVHFTYKDIYYYFLEFYRVLVEGREYFSSLQCSC